MSRTQWDDGLHVVNGTDAPEAVPLGSQVPKEPVSTRETSTYPQYSPLMRPNSPGKQDEEQRGHFLLRSGAPSPGLETATPKRRICGLRRSTFFLTVALLAVIVIAAVGGGVGGFVAVRNAKSSAPPSTATEPSATAGSIITVPTEGVLAFDCAAVASSGNPVITLGMKNWEFGVGCNQNLKDSANLAGLIAYSFEECLRSCAHTNLLTNNTCVGLAFNGDLSLFVGEHYGNCFLKKTLKSPKPESKSLAAIATVVSSWTDDLSPAATTAS